MGAWGGLVGLSVFEYITHALRIHFGSMPESLQ